MGKLSINIGEVYGRLAVLSREPDKMRGRPVFLCRCTCGKETAVWACSLRSGNTRSCGCLDMERSKAWAPVMNKRYVQRPLGAAALTATFGQNKRAALVRKFSFLLTEAEFYRISQLPCDYCGSPPSNRAVSKVSGDFVYNGLDRLDNLRGYEQDNVVPCCFSCNRAKWNWTKDQFLTWAEKARSHLKLRQ